MIYPVYKFKKKKKQVKIYSLDIFISQFWKSVSQEYGMPISLRIFQFVVIHIVKGFSIINEAEVDVFFWNSLTFFMIQRMLAIDLWFLCLF